MMDEYHLATIEYISIGGWAGFTLLGFLYMLSARRMIKHLDVPTITKQRLYWSTILGFVVYICAAGSIIATLLFQVLITEEYIYRVLLGRFFWLVVCGSVIWFWSKLERSSREQQSAMHRDARRRELEDYFKE